MSLSGHSHFYMQMSRSYLIEISLSVLNFILKCECNGCKYFVSSGLFWVFIVYVLSIIKVPLHCLPRLAVLMPWSMCQVRIFWTSGSIVELHGLTFFQVILNNTLHAS